MNDAGHLASGLQINGRGQVVYWDSLSLLSGTIYLGIPSGQSTPASNSLLLN